ncbi:hypothetical protein Tco_0211263 [Tanacetum coccineum]
MIRVAASKAFSITFTVLVITASLECLFVVPRLSHESTSSLKEASESFKSIEFPFQLFLDNYGIFLDDDIITSEVPDMFNQEIVTFKSFDSINRWDQLFRPLLHRFLEPLCPDMINAQDIEHIIPPTPPRDTEPLVRSPISLSPSSSVGSSSPVR